MKLPQPLISGRFIKRYKRFFADVQLEDGRIVTAHCANSGTMKTCLQEGWKVVLSYHDDPKRKLKYTLQLIHNTDTWICLNTHLANKIVKEAIENKLISPLAGYDSLQTEVKISDKSRLDIVLSSPTKSCYIEIKTVTLKGKGNQVLFPDAVTTRGQKHLQELILLVESGKRAVLFFLVQRQDGKVFLPASDIDPKYALLLKEAHHKGVEILCYQSEIAQDTITVGSEVPVQIE